MKRFEKSVEMYSQFHGHKPRNVLEYRSNTGRPDRVLFMLGGAVRLIYNVQGKAYYNDFASNSKLLAEHEGAVLYIGVPTRVANALVFHQVGTAEEIYYKSNKSNGGGDGKMNTYRHPFPSCPKVFLDKSSSVWKIMGARLKINERGIIN